MLKRRKAICRAISGPVNQPMHTLATSFLRQAGVGRYADPRRIAAGMGAQLQAVVMIADLPVGARVRRGCIMFAWDEDPREWGLNLYVGIALWILQGAGVMTGQTDVYQLAAYLALPDGDPKWIAERAQHFVPRWFISAHRSIATVPSGLHLVS